MIHFLKVAGLGALGAGAVVIVIAVLCIRQVEKNGWER